MNNEKTVEDYLIEILQEFLCDEQVFTIMKQLDSYYRKKFADELLDKLQRNIENICANVHKAYCEWHVKDGRGEYWTKGNYSLLKEEVKEADRFTVKSVIDDIKKVLGEL